MTMVLNIIVSIILLTVYSNGECGDADRIGKSNGVKIGVSFPAVDAYKGVNKTGLLGVNNSDSSFFVIVRNETLSDLKFYRGRGNSGYKNIKLIFVDSVGVVTEVQMDDLPPGSEPDRSIVISPDESMVIQIVPFDKYWSKFRSLKSGKYTMRAVYSASIANIGKLDWVGTSTSNEFTVEIINSH